MGTGYSANSVSYPEVRAEIRDGDVLLYKGRTLFSRLIRWATRSRYSHAGIAVWWFDRLMVMEAVGRGVMVTPLSSNVARYHGGVEWFTSVDPISEEERRRMVLFAQQELGKQYARWKSTLLGLKLIFSRNPEKRDKLRRERKLFCSLYVAQIYNAVGRDLRKNLSDWFTTPADIATSPRLKRAGILRKRR